MKNLLARLRSLFKEEDEIVPTYNKTKTNDKKLKESISKKTRDAGRKLPDYTVTEIVSPVLSLFFVTYPNSKLVNQYPHIITMLGICNNRYEAIEYLDALLLKEKDRESREGFPFEIYEELMFLDKLFRENTP